MLPLKPVCSRHPHLRCQSAPCLLAQGGVSHTVEATSFVQQALAGCHPPASACTIHRASGLFRYPTDNSPTLRLASRVVLLPAMPWLAGSCPAYHGSNREGHGSEARPSHQAKRQQPASCHHPLCHSQHRPSACHRCVFPLCTLLDLSSHTFRQSVPDVEMPSLACWKQALDTVTCTPTHARHAHVTLVTINPGTHPW